MDQGIARETLEKDAFMNKKYHTHTLVWLSRTVGKEKIHVLFLAFLQAALGASGILYAFLFRSLIDWAVEKDEGGFIRAVAGLAVLVVSQMALNALGNFLYEWSRAVIENRLKERLFSCLLYKSYVSVTDVHSGEWMNRLTSDTGVVAGGILEIVPGLTGMVIRLAGALIAICMLEPLFASILIPGGFLILLLTYGFRKILKRLHKQIQEADGAVRVFLQERLGNLMIVRTFAMEKRTLENASEKMRQHKAARIRRNLLSNLCNTAFGAVANGMYLFSAIYCGYGILQGTISYGTMIAMLQLIGQVQSPFANITGYLPKYYTMIASAERLMEAEYFQEDCEGERISPQEISRFYREEFKSIGLRKVSFAYRPRNGDLKTVVLNQIDIDIQKGEYVAFTGRSGCGKSTVLKLLMSLYPLDAGECYISSKAAEGREQLLDARWRGLFAFVPQGNQLMSGTIREAVAFGDSEEMRQEERMMEALRIACADEFVNHLQDGLDTMLGERGSGLSEGQMQRLAIARAIFSGHPILMLDEATSALDEETEQRLLGNLKNMTDKTVLIVTHRSAVLEICDKQIAMGQRSCATVH